MHTRPFRQFLPVTRVISIVSVLFALPASAQTLYWDLNGAAAGSSAGTTAAGTWDSTTANWSTSSTGTTAPQARSGTSGTAVFSAGTNATDAYTVTVAGTQSGTDLRFHLGNVTLQGGTLNFQDTFVASGLTATISSAVSPSFSFFKNGAGTLNLTGTSVVGASIYVNTGTLAITGAGATLTRPFNQNPDITLSVSTSFVVSDGATISGSGLTLRGYAGFGNGVFTVANGGTLRVWSTSSNGGVTLNDTIVFNTFSGSPILAGGTLQTDHFGLKTSAPFTLAASTTSNFDTNGASFILSGVISGDGALNKIGAGTYTAYGDNTYSGGTTLTAGTLALGHLNALGTGPLTFAGGTLHVEGLSPTFATLLIPSGGLGVAGAGTVVTSSGAIELANAGTGAITIASGGKLVSTASTAAGLASGTGTISVDGAGSTLQVGTDFYAGFNGTGTLSISGAGSASSGANSFLGYEAAGSGTATVTGAGSTWNISGYLEAGHAGSGTLNVSDGGTVSTTTSAAAGVVAGGTGAIHVTGSGAALNVGTTLFSGYEGTGTVSVGSGGIITADTVHLGAAAGSSGTVNVNSGGTLRLGGLNAGSGAATLNLAGGTLVAISRSFATAVPLTLAAGTTSSLAVSGLAVTFNAPISGAGALANDGVGIVALSANNSFSGGFAMNAGTLLLGNAGGLGTGPVALNGGNVDFGGFTPTISNLIFNGGTFTNGSLAGTAAFEVRSGTLGYTLSGGGSLNKTTSNAATVTGNNSHTGGTTLTAGTLTLGHVNALGTGPLTFAGGNLHVQGVSPTYTPFVIQNGGATVTGAGTVLGSGTYMEIGNGGTGTLNITAAGKADAAASVVAGINSAGHGTINVDGAGSLLEVGTFLTAGYHANTTGTLALTNGASATVGQYAIAGNEGAGVISVASGASLTTAHDLNLGLGATGSGTLTVSSGGDVVSGLNGYVGYAGASAATITGTGSTWGIAGFLEVGHGATGLLSILDGGQVTANTSTALGLNAGIAGTLNVSGANSTLSTGTTLYTGFGGAGTLTVASGGSIAADSVDLARNAGSSGTIHVNSGGTLRLGGLTRGAGAATVNLAGGTLEIINRSFTTSVPLTLAASSTSSISISGLAVQLDGVISGGGGLTKNGAGLVTLSAANTYTGHTTLNLGTLILAHDSALGAGTLTANGGVVGISVGNRTLANALTIAGPTTLDTGTLTWTQNGALSGAGAWSKIGTGSLILGAANTHSGAVDLTAGALTLGHASSLGTSTTTVRAGTVLDLGNFTAASGSLILDGGTLQNGTFAAGSLDPRAGTVGVVLNGSGGLAKTGAGTLTLTATNPFTGATTVNGGSLLLDGTSAQITQTSGLMVGNTAAGTLGITNNARVVTSGLAQFGNTTGNPGTVSVNGAGSLLQVAGYLEVGRGGADAGSSLAITAGGRVAVTASTALAAGAGGSSTLTIDGENSLLSSGTAVYLGHSGTGTVNLTDRGRLTAGSFIDVGALAGSNGQVTVSGTGSELFTNAHLQVGVSGTGSLQVLNAGRAVSTTTTTLGYVGNGTALVSGTGSRLEVGTVLFNGYQGAGALTIANGGTVTIGSSAIFGSLAGSQGTLNLNAGGTLAVGGIDGLRQGSGAATLNLAGGTLRVSGAALTTTLSATVTNTSTLDTNNLGATWSGVLSGTGALVKTGAGTLTLGAANTFNGGTTISAGTLQLGASGRLFSTGALTLAGGTLATAGFSQTLGPLTLGASSTIDFGAGASALVFANSSALAWTGTLTLLNYTTSQDSLRIGTTNTGLTSTQLGQIDFGSGLLAQIDANGFVTGISAIPEPSTYAAFIGACALGLAAWRKRRA